jgi:hypothetical protein
MVQAMTGACENHMVLFGWFQQEYILGLKLTPWIWPPVWWCLWECYIVPVGRSCSSTALTWLHIKANTTSIRSLFWIKLWWYQPTSLEKSASTAHILILNFMASPSWITFKSFLEASFCRTKQVISLDGCCVCGVRNAWCSGSYL